MSMLNHCLSKSNLSTKRIQTIVLSDLEIKDLPTWLRFLHKAHSRILMNQIAHCCKDNIGISNLAHAA